MKFLKIHPRDTVAVALEQLAQQDLKQLVAHGACSAAKRRVSRRAKRSTITSSSGAMPST